jgi:hypothetical protein
VARHQLTKLLLVFSARERCREIFAACVAHLVQPMDPHPAPGVIRPDLAVLLQCVFFGLAAKHRHANRPALKRSSQAIPASWLLLTMG